jgi:hypothetical protein
MLSFKIDLRERPQFSEISNENFFHRPSPAQRAWLRRGLEQPGGKLPLFDRDGKRVSRVMMQACLAAGWAEPWFANPSKPDWMVCKLTETGRRAAAAAH